MKKIAFLLVVLFTFSTIFAQKKDKIKGSKIITHTIKEVENFVNIEVEDNVEIYLVKADTPSIEIEADDNLHDVVNFVVTGNTLRVTTLKTVSSAKKFDLRVNYASDLKLITVKNDAKLHALNALQLDSITIQNFDNSASYLNVNSNSFKLILNDKSEAELNIKAKNTVLELSKSAELKALVASPEIKIDMYEKAEATIEGDAANAKIRLDNNALLTAKKFTVGTIDLTVENYAKCEVNAANEIALSASGKTQVELYGEPKIEIRKFTNTTTLYKKEK
ncbi:MAG: DUF2807 domain-containing protein [Flavobacterium sp.]|uniref:GIN domain-containing protein n=1 Tax=Flavobacterium sp. TaxID=239 RepID=UPI000C68660F|nr:DUF2807 domain-containing protein [Flavobacterium sp.]MBF02929.1 DUF2807 domain-containing protein [Flavobacterium sp.]|tara:strand:+ start:429 stop:1262 length:834 start_codon:yes stop_codon:yes gene_type:complete